MQRKFFPFVMGGGGKYFQLFKGKNPNMLKRCWNGEKMVKKSILKNFGFPTRAGGGGKNPLVGIFQQFFIDF